MKRTYYYIREKGAYHSYSKSGYSRYFQRLVLRDSGKLTGHVYGPKQATEHVKELRHSVYEGKKIRLNLTFEVVRVVTTETVIKTLLPVSS